MIYREANRATSAGDIGRLVYMYERFALLFHGITGIKQYRTFLPRFLAQIKHDLPPDLAEAVLSGELITPNARPGCFVPKDLALEHRNGWLEYFAQAQVRLFS